MAQIKTCAHKLPPVFVDTVGEVRRERGLGKRRSWKRRTGDQPSAPNRINATATSKVDSSWNVMAHGDVREGKWRGNWRMKWVASTLHTTSEHGVSRITTVDAYISAASSRLNWRPCRFKLTRPFHRKTKSCFCVCAITFQLDSNTVELTKENHFHAQTKQVFLSKFKTKFFTMNPRLVYCMQYAVFRPLYWSRNSIACKSQFLPNYIIIEHCLVAM